MILDNSLNLEQKLSLSPAQLQSLEMLAMCNADLRTFLENEYNENPLLDYREGHEMLSAGQNRPEAFSAFRGGSSFLPGEGAADQSDEHRSFLENIPAAEKKSAEQHFSEQLDFRGMDRETERILRILIQNVDSAGFYTLSAGETAMLAHCDRQKAEQCLDIVRSLEPAGCFWPTMEESLMAQLVSLGVEDEILNRIIRENLEDLGKGKLSVITRKYGITTAEARKYKQLLTLLDPKPLAAYTDSGTTEYIVPDILILERDESLEAELNDSWVGNYSLNDFYLKMIETCQEEELKAYFQAKLDKARFVLNSIEQRRQTILRITEAVIRRQEAFFRGSGSLRPMTMKEVAQELSVSPSTIGRAVGNKYVQYPVGVISFRRLFSQSVGKEPSEEGNTAQEIKKMLCALIAEEDPGSPLSDSAISQKLKEKGVTLSRRGVAKYRGECGIPGSFDRKK